MIATRVDVPPRRQASLADRLAQTCLFAALLLSHSPAALANELPLPIRISKPSLTVRAEAGLEDLATRVAEQAPSVLTAINEDLAGLPRPPRVEIRLVKRAADIGRAAPAGRGPPNWADGVAYSDVGVVVIATRRGANSISVDGVVAHELAHLALDAALGDRAPRWLHEGFAYLHSSDWSFARLRTLTGMAWSGNTIPIHELDDRFPARKNDATRAYAQSYDFVVFLARRGRYHDRFDDGDRWTFRAFLAAIAAGSDVYSAAREAYGASLDELYAEWYQSLRQRYLLLPVGLFAMGIWVIAALLLIAGYLRKRRLNRIKLARWAEEERTEAAASVKIDPGDALPQVDSTRAD